MMLSGSVLLAAGTLIGYLIFNKGVEVLGGNTASMYLNLTPIVATWRR